MADPTILTVLKVVTITFSVVSFIGNALVCHLIVRLKTMKTSINYIILNLAILDAISGILTINSVIINDRDEAMVKSVFPLAFNQSVLLAEVLCKINWIYWFGPTVSPLLLVAMGYERYKAIVHPFSRLQGKVTKSRLKILFIVAWLSGLVYLLIDLIVAKYDVESSICFVENNTWFKIKLYTAFHLTTQNIIPSTLIFAFYFCVIRALAKQDHRLRPQATAQSARRKVRKKVMRVIIAVTLVFYICCGIPQIVLACFTLSNILLESLIIVEILLMMLSINSAFNPIMYFMFVQSFRNGFKTVFLSRKTNLNANFHLNGIQKSFSLENNRCGTNEQSNLPKLLAFVNPAEYQRN